MAKKTLGQGISKDQFSSEKDYLLYLAITYIEEHTGWLGVDDDVIIDGVLCDGHSLAETLRETFDVNEPE